MLFRVDEMRFMKGYVEFRMDEEHVVGTQQFSGYAFRVYSGADMKCFLKLWLESIDRECEEVLFHSGKAVANAYTSFVSRHGETFTFSVDDIEHGKIYSYI